MTSQIITAKDMENDNRTLIACLYDGVSCEKELAQEIPASLKIFNYFFTMVKAAFPEYQLKVESLMTKQDKVMVRYIISGIQEGIFMGMEPTHEKMSITGIDVFRLERGQVVEHWDASFQISADP